MGMNPFCAVLAD